MRTIVHFAEDRYKKELAELNNELKQLNEAVSCSKEIHQGEPQKLSIEKIQERIQERTGFPNVLAGANLLGLEDEYTFIRNTLKEAKHLDKFEFVKDQYIIPPTSLETLKDKYTTYLSEEKEQAYKKIKKAVDTLNEFPTAINRVVTKTGATSKDAFQINLFRLNYEQI